VPRRSPLGFTTSLERLPEPIQDTTTRCSSAMPRPPAWLLVGDLPGRRHQEDINCPVFVRPRWNTTTSGGAAATLRNGSAKPISISSSRRPTQTIWLLAGGLEPLLLAAMEGEPKPLRKVAVDQIPSAQGQGRNYPPCHAAWLPC